MSCLQVGREGCKKGVCTLYCNTEDMILEFPHLGVQCVRRKDVEQSLKQRKQIRVDPFRQGFKHMDSAASIDLNAVRLCFQVKSINIKLGVLLLLLFWSFCLLPIISSQQNQQMALLKL